MSDALQKTAPRAARRPFPPVSLASTLDTAWLRQLGDSVPAYLARLRVGDQVGRYLPCERGASLVGREMALGWSCFALKLHYMLGRWEGLPDSERAAWVRFLQSFQKNDGEAAFVDPPEQAWLESHLPWRDRLRYWFRRGQMAQLAHATTLAETKQVIATLAEVSAEPRRVFSGFPHTPETVRAWLEAQNWARPWGAGGQSAGLVVFIKTQGPKFLAASDVEALLAVCRDFYASIADPETGAYFRSRSQPEHGELVNGAMKVLMALEWLEVAPHFPQQLMATCLRQPPSPRGCHLVDAIYVLHQCLAGREADATTREFCMQVFGQIRQHAQSDGGFSFHADKAQNNYYGVPVSRGLRESDVQGTCLLVWALAMIWRVMEPGGAEWKVMKP